MADITTVQLPEDEHSVQLRRAVIASTIGTAIEWYVFFLYSTLTRLVFVKLYFPNSDPLVGTLQAFSVYAVGFVARPIGAAIFGHYGDRIGRKATLVSTLLLMGIATFLVGLVPSYEVVGIWGAVIGDDGQPTTQPARIIDPGPGRYAKWPQIRALGDRALFNQHQPPQGYFAPGRDMAQRLKAVAAIATLTGEFEKPRFVQYRANLCAHGRNRKTGCTQCIDVCSTRAIHSEGERVVVSTQLCMGCGACTTVCPSGALSYTVPRVADLGAQIKTVLRTYHGAGGKDAILLLHDGEQGAAAIAALARHGEGLPARCIPLALHHAAAAGLDVWLGAVAYGATEVAVLVTPSVAPEYLITLNAQAGVANRILAALGYQGARVRIVDERELAFPAWAETRGLGVRVAASFNLSNDKRGTLDAVFAHLHEHAPTPVPLIAL